MLKTQNDIRLYTKRLFAKCLANHKAEIIDCRDERLTTNHHNDSFCVDTLISVPKKDEDSRQCCSGRPIKNSSALCKLLVLLVVKDVNKACSTLDNQFGFMEGFSREHLHYILANILKDIESSGEFPVYAAHNVFRAFDSGVHSRLLYSAQL